MEKARKRLETDRYQFVTYLEPESPGNPLVLHVRKIEVHSEATLHLRNGQLFVLAEQLGLASYDGVDAGPVELDPTLAEP